MNIRLDKIEKVITSEYPEILNTSRKKEMVITRQFLSVIMRAQDIPLTKIASILNKKNHTTIRNYLNKHKDYVDVDEDYKMEFRSFSLNFTRKYKRY